MPAGTRWHPLFLAAARGFRGDGARDADGRVRIPRVSAGPEHPRSSLHFVSPSPLDQVEQTRRHEAIDDLVNRIATSSGKADEWWNATTYEELGGRTPSEALLDGDHDGVLRLIAGWYQQSEERIGQIRRDQAILEVIEDRRRSIAEQTDQRRSA